MQTEIRRLRRLRALGGEAACGSCGEKDPVVLRRQGGGPVRCLRCQALERAERVPDTTMTITDLVAFRRSCTVCGFVAPRGLDDRALFELHHVGGRAHAEFVVPLCRNCHAKVNELQRANGVDLQTLDTPAARAVQAAASWLAQVNVAAQQAQARGRGFWSGLLDVTPSLMSGLPAILQAAYMNPEGDES